MDNNIKIATDNGSGSLFDKIVSLIEQARARVATAVNTAEVYTKRLVPKTDQTIW